MVLCGRFPSSELEWFLAYGDKNKNHHSVLLLQRSSSRKMAQNARSLACVCGLCQNRSENRSSSFSNIYLPQSGRLYWKINFVELARVCAWFFRVSQCGESVVSFASLGGACRRKIKRGQFNYSSRTSTIVELSSRVSARVKLLFYSI